MKILKIIGIIVLVIVLLGVGVIIFGPSSAHLERQTTIEAPAEVIFAEVTNMRTFNTWSPWFAMDPDAEYVWEGPSSGLGAKMTWYSNDENVGNGYMVISETRANEFVAMDMGFDQNGNRDFTDEGEEKPAASFILEEDGDRTTVTWTFDITGVSGGGKFFILMLDTFLGSFYEQGLASLKERVESRPDFTYDIEQIETQAQPYIGVGASSSSDPADIGEAMGEAYGKVMSYLSANSIESQGAPISINISYDEQNAEMICAIPVAEVMEVEEELVSGQTYEGQALKTVYYGNYDDIGNAHEDLNAYISYYQFERNGQPWEEYITDPMSEPDTSKWMTNVYYPVK